MGNLIKVSAQSRTSSVAGAIAGMVREDGEAEMQAIGASAVNQAIKAVAIARGYLSESGDGDIGVAPVLNDIDLNGVERTAVRFRIFRR